MKRAVITGFGIISSIGNNKEEVLASLKAGKSGIEVVPEFVEMKMRSHVAGTVKLNPAEHIDRKVYRFMGDAAAYAYLSMREAIEDAGLSEDQVSNERTGLVIGAGTGSAHNQLVACDAVRGPRGVKALALTRLPKPWHPVFLPVWQPLIKSVAQAIPSAPLVQLPLTVSAMPLN